MSLFSAQRAWNLKKVQQLKHQLLTLTIRRFGKLELLIGNGSQMSIRNYRQQGLVSILTLVPKKGFFGKLMFFEKKLFLKTWNFENYSCLVACKPRSCACSKLGRIPGIKGQDLLAWIWSRMDSLGYFQPQVHDVVFHQTNLKATLVKNQFLTHSPKKSWPEPNEETIVLSEIYPKTFLAHVSPVSSSASSASEAGAC